MAPISFAAEGSRAHISREIPGWPGNAGRRIHPFLTVVMGPDAC
jgi:hypothetical protein